MKLFLIYRDISHLHPKINIYINMQDICSFKTVPIKIACQLLATAINLKAT